MGEDWNLFERLVAGYDEGLDKDGVRGERLAFRLFALSEIGLTEEFGSFRIGFSAEERAAKRMVKTWMEEAGLTVTVDGAGNVFGRLQGKDATLPAILSGSHVDSVPNGGHFDGPLGVLAALEVVEAWKVTGYVPERSFQVVVFSDEEGARFNGGFLGSSPMVGDIDRDETLQLVDINGTPFSEVLESVGLSVESFFTAKRDLSDIEAFIEVHIEQGKQLEKANLPVGIVTGIAGPCWLEMTLTGSAGHAGNTPMNDRRDALVAAGQFISELPSLPAQFSDSAVATVGKLQVYPNGVNVIPGQVRFSVDIRDITEETREGLIQAVLSKAESICRQHNIDLEWKETIRVDPVPIKEALQEKLADSVMAHNIEPFYLASGAGHDAMIIGRHVPAAMLFVQSKDGISHNPAEWSTLSDCVQAVHVLKDFVERY